MNTISAKDEYKLTTYGLYDDGKPTNVPNGHRHIEMDTGKEFLYDEENDTWHEQPAGGGGGSSLPEVTSSDNGKVLGVEDGAWDAVDPSGGYFEVNVIADMYMAMWLQGFTFDKTYAEIQSAMEAGTPVLAMVKASAQGSVLAIAPVEKASNTSYRVHALYFFGKEYDIYIDSTDTVSYAEVVVDFDPFYIKFTLGNRSSDSYIPVTFDKTKEQIQAARGNGQSGKIFVAIVSDSYASPEIYIGAMEALIDTYTYTPYWRVKFLTTDNQGEEKCLTLTLYENSGTNPATASASMAYLNANSIKLEESNGALAGTLPKYAYELTEPPEFYMNYWDSNVSKQILKTFTLVSLESYGLSTVDIVIKDNSDGALYKHTGGYYVTALSFTPYTPTP